MDKTQAAEIARAAFKSRKTVVILAASVVAVVVATTVALSLPGGVPEPVDVAQPLPLVSPSVTAEVTYSPQPPTIPRTDLTFPPVTTYTPPPPTQVEMERKFLTEITKAGLDIQSTGARLDEYSLLGSARGVCRHLTDGGVPANPEGGFPGRTAEQYLVENEEVGKGTRNAQIIDLTVQYVCPQHAPILARAKTGSYPTAGPLTSFRDGTYVVGKIIAPGTYKTAPEAKDCYWERTTSGGGVIANDFVTFAPQGVTVTIRSGEGFVSEGCGAWTKTA
ncbi:hypothetical protein [Longispora urticae]